MTDKKSQQILNYCKQHSMADSPHLAKLEKHTWENEDVPQMISGQLVGKFLQLDSNN